MQYRTQNANLDSGCQALYIVTGEMGGETSRRSRLTDFVDHSIGVLLRCANDVQIKP